MKRKLLLITQVVLLALVGSFAGAAFGQFLPWSGYPTAYAQYEASPLTPIGNGFSYQGSLLDGGNPANGQYDFTFRLFDAPLGGAQVSSPITLTSQPVSDGLFTVSLDFGSSAFQGDARWLETGVRPSGGGGFTILTPRQPLTPAPYALFALDTPPYDNVIVVAKSGGDFTSVQAALASITDNTSANRYLVWVGPGTYTETVTMKQFVDIEGAGEILTKITAPGATGSTSATVRGVTNSELRSLTVESIGTGSPTFGRAIYNLGANLRNVTARASGGGENEGIYHDSSQGYDSTMSSVTVIVTGGQLATGVRNEWSFGTMTDVEVSVSGATQENNGIHNSSGGPTMFDVRVTASGGSNFTVGISNFMSSPVLTNGKVKVSGGTNHRAISLYDSSPTITDMTITAQGGSGDLNYGVYSRNDSLPTIIGTTINVTGGTESHGVYSDASSAAIQNSAISTSGAFSNYAVYNTNASGNRLVTIDNSALSGSTSTIRNLTQFTTRVGASKLAGGSVIPGGGALTCAGVHDENYAFFASTCP